jgi:hypothetical protein
MPLPVSVLLSLPETVRFVMERAGETESRICAALTEAALAGEIVATGCLHLSLLDPSRSKRYYDVYFSHGAVSNRENVPSGAWGAALSWPKSRVERYDIVRAEIDRWLGTAKAGHDVERKAVPAATVSLSESQTTDATVVRGNDTSPNTVSYSDLKSAIKQHGDAAESKLWAYAKDKFPQKRVPRHLLRLAREEVFGKPSRGAPKKARDKSPQ